MPNITPIISIVNNIFKKIEGRHRRKNRYVDNSQMEKLEY